MPNPSQNWLLRAKADLTPAIIAKAIARRLKKLGVYDDTRGANARLKFAVQFVVAGVMALWIIRTTTRPLVEAASMTLYYKTAEGAGDPAVAALLQRNLLIYGLGGVVVPFIGIKAIDRMLVMLHLT